jgi:hypothetical protein
MHFVAITNFCVRAAKQTPDHYGDIVAATIDFITESEVGWFHGGAMRSYDIEFIAARSSIDGFEGRLSPRSARALVGLRRLHPDRTLSGSSPRSSMVIGDGVVNRRTNRRNSTTAR